MWLDVLMAVGIVAVFAWGACRFINDLQRQAETSMFVRGHEDVARRRAAREDEL